jgi:hypothetical protein
MAILGEAAKQYFTANLIAKGVWFTQEDHLWSQIGSLLDYHAPEVASEIWRSQITLAAGAEIPLTLPMRHAEHLAAALSGFALNLFARAEMIFPGNECSRDNYVIAEAYRSWVRVLSEESADSAVELYARQHRDGELLDFVATTLQMRAEEVDWKRFGSATASTTDKGELLRRVQIIAACSPVSSSAICDDFADRYCAGDSELAKVALLALARSGDKRAFDLIDRQPDGHWKRFVLRYLVYSASFDPEEHSFDHLLKVLPLDMAGLVLARHPEPERVSAYCNAIEKELEVAESQYPAELGASFQEDRGLQVLARCEPDRLRRWGLRIAGSHVLGTRASGLCNALLRVMIGLDVKVALQMISGVDSSYVGLVRYQSGTPLYLYLLNQSNEPEAQSYCTATLMSARSDRDIFESVAASLEAHSSTIPEFCWRVARAGTREERAICARAMGWLGDARSRELLERMRIEDRSAWVRDVSEQALEAWWRTESAKQWYRRALAASSAMETVGACELAFRNADKLAFMWMREIERDHSADKLPFKKRAIILRMKESFDGEADKRIRELEQTFLSYTLRDVDLI